MNVFQSFTSREYAILFSGIVFCAYLLFRQYKRNKKYFKQAVIVDVIVLALLGGFIVYEQYFNQEVTNAVIDLDSIPSFSGEAYIEINNNQPFFTKEDLSKEPFESYHPLDALGRCGEAFALVTLDTLPKEEREPIDSIKPSGWQGAKYPFIDHEFLYHRCHLIAFELTGENANERNLITGTQFMNIEGMRPFENRVSLYVHTTGNSVLYRATPIFEKQNLIASGVLLEAYSIEDDGTGILFNVYCYNEQPGVVIDHKTGRNYSQNSE